MNSDDERKMQIQPQMIILSLLAIIVTVYIFMLSYNAVIPNITQKGSLKLTRINPTQALALMILTGMMCCSRM